MTRAEAIATIDTHKKALTDPVAQLTWTWVRSILMQLPDDQWNAALDKAVRVLSQ